MIISLTDPFLYLLHRALGLHRVLGCLLFFQWPAVVASGQSISFPDPVLESGVRDALQKHDGSITTTDMLSLTNLLFTDPEASLLVTNLEGLQYAANLEWLAAGAQSIESIHVLSNLFHLKALGLSFNRIRDAAPLKELTNLVTLDLGANPITNVDVIRPLAALANLSFGSMEVTSCDFVSNFTQLVSLAIQGSRVRDATPLKSLSHLQVLSLSGNTNIDISALGSLTNLRGFNVKQVGLTNLAIPMLFTNLEWLAFSYNRVQDIAPLLALPKLTFLEFEWNYATNIVTLTNLIHLETVYLDFNFIDLSPGLPSANAVAVLRSRNNSYVETYYQAQWGQARLNPRLIPDGLAIDVTTSPTNLQHELQFTATLNNWFTFRIESGSSSVQVPTYVLSSSSNLFFRAAPHFVR